MGVEHTGIHIPHAGATTVYFGACKWHDSQTGVGLTLDSMGRGCDHGADMRTNMGTR
jgi:hypothetical protein